jgi:predicted RNase H-like HicB family nuclease
MRYSVNIQKTDEGYSVREPDLPGCWSQGATEEEALENIKEAIEDYVHVMDLLSAEKVVRYVEVAHA